ncbi:MAG: hypothetical protein B0D92_04805 [Spirochaeta sp. LUC14_002_19_P3]|nr:MAG: hypothetical protein B0D92_04805 [Spirochaeta sp. LUC14_002_19_P3]
MFTEAEFWAIRCTPQDISVLLRTEHTKQCLAVSIEPGEARDILQAISKDDEDTQNFSEFFSLFTQAISMPPEYIEISQSDEEGTYTAMVHFSDHNLGSGKNIAVEAHTPLALTLAAYFSIPIFLEDALLEAEGSKIMPTENWNAPAEYLAKLKGELEQKVREEEYEQAAAIRDHIKQIEGIL